MLRKNKKLIVAAIAALLVAGTALAAYVTHDARKEETQVATPVHRVHNQQVAAAQPAPPPCNDGNIVGTLAGGVAGGVIGHQIGKGSGNTVATIGGALGGAVIGNQMIPTRNVTCR